MLPIMYRLQSDKFKVSSWHYTQIIENEYFPFFSELFQIPMYSTSPNIFGESGVYQITYKSLSEFEQLRERRVAEEAGLPLSHKSPQWNNKKKFSFYSV